MKEGNFSKDLLKTAADAIKGDLENIKVMVDKCKEKSASVVAVEVLMSKLDISELEAESVVEEISKGITGFKGNYESNKEKGEVCNVEQIKNLTKDLSDEERHKFFASLLTSFQLIGEADVTESVISKALEKNLEREDPLLIEEIMNHLDTSVPIEKISDLVKDGVDTEVLSQVAETIRSNKDDYQLMTAVWIYIAQKEGVVKLSESGESLPPSVLGALAGACIEVIEATDLLEKGEIELKTWQMILKGILGALLVFALTVCMLYLMAMPIFNVIFLIIDIFGMGIAGIIVSVLFMSVIGVVGALLMCKIDMAILDLLSPLYDKVIGPITAFFQGLARKVKSLAIKGKEMSGEIAVKAPKQEGKEKDKEPEGEPESPIPIPPVMA